MWYISIHFLSFGAVGSVGIYIAGGECQWNEWWSDHTTCWVFLHSQDKVFEASLIGPSIMGSVSLSLSLCLSLHSSLLIEQIWPCAILRSSNKMMILPDANFSCRIWHSWSWQRGTNVWRCYHLSSIKSWILFNVELLKHNIWNDSYMRKRKKNNAWTWIWVDYQTSPIWNAVHVILWSCFLFLSKLVFKAVPQISFWKKRISMRGYPKHLQQIWSSLDTTSSPLC